MFQNQTASGILPTTGETAPDNNIFLLIFTLKKTILTLDFPVFIVILLRRIFVSVNMEFCLA